MSHTLAEQTSQAVTRDLFRRVLGQFATGVTVVTVRCGEEVRGMTANSFTSVSLDPPLILVCVDTRARTCTMLSEARRFCVNILDETQQTISDRFAGRRPAEHGEFGDCSCAVTSSGAPVLKGGLAYLDCSVVQTCEAGDHTVFIARVESLCVTGEGNPLLFFKGRYTRINFDSANSA